MTRRAPDNTKALDAFIAAKSEIDAMLERLAALSADHFETSPDEINWGHVGTPEPLPRQTARDHRHGLQGRRTRRVRQPAPGPARQLAGSTS